MYYIEYYIETEKPQRLLICSNLVKFLLMSTYILWSFYYSRLPSVFLERSLELFFAFHPPSSTLRVVMSYRLLWFIGAIAVWDSLLLLTFGSLYVTFCLYERQSSGSRQSDQFQLRRLWALLPALHDVLINRDLPFTSGGTKGNSNMLYVLGISGTILTNNSKERLSCLVLEFLLGGLCILEGALSTQMRNFLLNYSNM